MADQIRVCDEPGMVIRGDASELLGALATLRSELERDMPGHVRQFAFHPYPVKAG